MTSAYAPGRQAGQDLRRRDPAHLVAALRQAAAARSGAAAQGHGARRRLRHRLSRARDPAKMDDAGPHHRHRPLVADARRGAHQGRARSRASASSSARESATAASCRSPTTSTISSCATPGSHEFDDPERGHPRLRARRQAGRARRRHAAARRHLRRVLRPLSRGADQARSRRTRSIASTRYLTRYPPLEQVEAWFEDAGLVDVKARVRDLHAAVQVEPRVLLRAAHRVRPARRVEGDRRQGPADAGRVLAAARARSTPTSRGRAFAVTVNAGCVRGRKEVASAGRRARRRHRRQAERAHRRGRARHRRDFDIVGEQKQARGARRRRRRRAARSRSCDRRATDRRTRRWRARS